MRGRLLALGASAMLFVGATYGLEGVTDVTPEHLGFDGATASAMNTAARAQLLEGVFFYMAAWISAVAEFAAAHPVLARLVLLNAPVLLILAVVSPYLARAALVAYVLYDERRR